MSTDLQRILESVDDRSPLGAYAQAARDLRSLDGELRPVKVALLASYTINSLVPYLQVEAARYGYGTDVYVGNFNAVTQELLDPNSGCLAHDPDVVFVAQQLSEVAPAMAEDFLALGAEQVEAAIDDIVSGLIATLGEFRKLSQAAVVVHNFALPANALLGIYEPMSQDSQSEAIRTLNRRLVEAARSLPGVYVLDYDRLSAEVGYRNWYDAKMWHLGRAPLSALAMPVVARAQATFVQAIVGKPRKCLVVDLDNTLWGGVVGEEGVAGIKLGQTYPGSAFRQVQQTILQLFRQGVILAINSKNNPADVDEVFKAHPDMVLKPEHFASTRVNWQDKVQNMREIAEELNVGIDSLVFFDDNPAERAIVREHLPEVLVLEVPTDPMKYSQVLIDSRAFEKLSLTEEDRRRGEMYREQVVRRTLEQSATTLEDFYRSLEMSVTIAQVDDFAFPRVVDLINKTNQFNLTTRRYTAAQVSEMRADPSYGVFYIGVEDRFGDNGIVGVGIVKVNGETAYVDTMLLSCRVIGRTVETAFLRYLADWVAKRGATEMVGEFIPTAKNAPAADFYARHGFEKVEESGGSGSRWRISLADLPFAFPEYIRLTGQTEEEKSLAHAN